MAWYNGANGELIDGGGGGDFTKVQDFEGAYDGIDISGTDGVKARIKGIPTDAGTQIYFGGWSNNLSSSCKIQIEAESGYETDGSHDASNYVSKKWTFLEDTYTWFMDVIGLEFYVALGVINITTAWEIRVANCLIDGNGSNSYGVYITTCGTGTLRIGTSQFCNFTGSNYGMGLYSKDADATTECIHVTVANNYYKGISQTNGTVTLKNVAVVNSNDDLSGTISETNVLTEDDAELTNDDADDFTAPSTADYTVYDTDSALYQAGVAPTESWFTTLCPTDLAGNAWGVTPAVGCFEYVAAGGGWTGKICGVTNPSKICGVAVANISKVNGV